jgi:L-lactate dehydrogenase (cytochrome)
MTIVNIEDLRRLARKRLPRAIFEFVDGGAHDELTLRANRADLDSIRFRPRVLRDVSTRSLATKVFGAEQSLPLVLAPIGLCGLTAGRGEILAARAAARCGIPLCLSTVAVSSIEEVRAASPRPFWFQLYIWKDRGLARELVERAQAAGCTALVFTADTIALGLREADVRNGFTVPPRVTVANALDTLRRVDWICDVLFGPRITFGNFAGPGKGNIMTLASHMELMRDASLDWGTVDWLRSIWKGPLVIKGILSPEDARLAAEHGADGIVVSNHGGRQLDGAPSSIAALPAVAEAVGSRMTVLFDGGIRRGHDVIKAIALGAHACLIGRAFVYGLAALGEAGVERVLGILAADMDSALALLGRRNIAEIDRSAVE